VLREDGEHALGSVALVQEDGQADLGRELQLRLEPALLDIARREVAIEIEPTLTDGDDLRLFGQRS
jgi:hypothetical protein